MNRVFSLIYIFAISLICSCSSSGVGVSTDSDDTYGKISLTLSSDGEFATVESVSSSKIALTKSSDVDVSSFSVSIYRSSGDLYHSYEMYSDIPDVSQLPVDIYTISVESGTLASVAFDSPYYMGENDNVVIKEDQLTEAEVTCLLSNSKLTFNVSDEFKATYRDYTITVSNDGGSVSVTPTETRSVYVDPSLTYDIVITAWGYGSDDDDPVQFTYNDLTAEPQTHYMMSINMASTGSTSVTVVIDPTVIETNLEIVIPGEEDLGDNEEPIWPSESESDSDTDSDTDTDADTEAESELPTIEGTTFDISNSVTITDGQAGTTTIAALITANNGGIANLYATLDSPDIDDTIINALFDGSATFDLANLVDGSSTKSMLISVGLISEDTVIKGATSYLFDVTAFMGLLTSGSYGSEIHKFHIRVVDANGGEASQTLTVIRTN